MKEFTIFRNKWLRGGKDGFGNDEGASLCTDDGQKCCLGHIMTQCGIKKIQLLDKGDPADVLTDENGQGRPRVQSEQLRKAVNFLYNNSKGANTKLTEQAVSINDDHNIDDEERERQLTALFSKNKIRLTFVG